MAISHEVPGGEGDGRLSNPIDFRRSPDSYRHWLVAVDGATAVVTMAVDPKGGLADDYQLKLNSYDLSVDIELYDIVQRLRFEHPEVAVVVLTSALDRVFCAGANIQMLAGATHDHKVNFCKFTNETRFGIEDASEASGQRWIAALNGTAAGGGYELALACDEIILVDDRSSTVSLPELPLLGVLPGTGGLTRVVDKRHVRRDVADVFATRAEGVRGEQALNWRLVDSIAPPSTFTKHVNARASEVASSASRPAGPGVPLHTLTRHFDALSIGYSNLRIDLEPDTSVAHFYLKGPGDHEPETVDQLVAAGDQAWVLRLCRELDDAILHLRLNETELGTWAFHTQGDLEAVVAVEDFLEREADHWLVKEIRAYWKRTLKRLDTSARTLVSLVEQGSCYAGTLAELVLAADRSFMLDGDGEGVELSSPHVVLMPVNDGLYPMANGLSRLGSRFWGRPGDLEAARDHFGKALPASVCLDVGLVTFTPDDLDWDDEVRLALEERAAFSPDALTGLEANLRFVGPETMETKVFARLSAWQNWIFLRPNASGREGALRQYGTGSRPSYDRKRV
jgi:benzoyl-CoA-dihydrodiol lyase